MLAPFSLVVYGKADNKEKTIPTNIHYRLSNLKPFKPNIFSIKILEDF